MSENRKHKVKGEMLWVSANNLARMKSLSELSNNLVEYEKTLSMLKSPSDKVIAALREQFNVTGSIDTLSRIDALLGLNKAPVDAVTMPEEPTEKQLDLVGFADEQADLITEETNPQFNPSLRIGQLAALVHPSRNESWLSRRNTKGRLALGLDAKKESELTEADKQRLFQWHLDNKA